MPTATRYLRSVVPLLRWCGLAVGPSALALILMLLLKPLMEHSIFFYFLAAVAVSAMYGGLGPGLVATLISALAANYFFLEPQYALFTNMQEALRFGIFLATGVIISVLAQYHKRVEDQLRARNEDLEEWASLRRALEEQLEWKVSHDDLTSLHNQASFYEHLKRALARARHEGRKVAMLFIDLDDFKLVNDHLGHQEGDRVLREVAKRLKRCLRESDIAARMGGDELAVLMEDVADSSEAVMLAERFHAQLRDPLYVHSYRVHTSASIGIAVGTQGPPEKLVRDADLAMYRAKRTGKARSVVFGPKSPPDNST